MDKVLTLYPQNVTLGSPFDTGTRNALTPEFKTIAAFLGDLVFQAPRRFFLRNVSGKQNTWSYCSLHLFPCLRVQVLLVLHRSRVDSHTVNKRLKSLPILGSVHASDIPIIYGGEDLTDYLINFATNLNPNGGSVAHWPPYTTLWPQLLTLYDAPVSTNVTLDTYRAEGIQFLTELSLVYPL
jgi:acetylcholinesterase